MVKRFESILIRTFAFFLTACLLSMVGNAEYRPTSQQRRLLLDHEAYFPEKQKLGPDELNMGKMGEYIDLNTGELSFRHTDVSLPGNFDLPVAFTRIIDSDNDRPTFTKSQIIQGYSGTANWGLDLPYILLPTIDSTGTIGCYNAASTVDVKDEMFVVPRIGTREQRWPLLDTSKYSNTDVFGKNIPNFSNSDNWRINQTKKNGNCEWTAVDTEGVVYEFGQTFVLATKNGKTKHAVLITKQTDVNGNTVTYTYDPNHRRLTLIEGSDGREIKLVYRGNGELECVITDNGKRVWMYAFKRVSGSSYAKYLSKVWLKQYRQWYWEYDQLAGVNNYNVSRNTSGTSGRFARRCVFGRNARVRNPDGLVADYVTEKIVNFTELPSDTGVEGTSHRAACLSSVDGGDFADGKSSFGNFSTSFTSAVKSKTLTDVDGSTVVWRYEYAEGDEFNSNQVRRTVHKNRNSPVYIDITKPKLRKVIDPLGNKYEFEFGRSLGNAGKLITTSVFAKGEKTPLRKISYEHKYSKNRLGNAWNRGRSVYKANEHWSRTSKRVWNEGSETYTVSTNFDSRGAEIKLSESSTVQTGSIVTETEVLHLDSKWILGLPVKKTVNGLEISGASFDTNGQIILETRFGEQFRRYKWDQDGSLIAVRNGADHISEYLNYKRGVPQKIVLPNDAVYTLSVDNNGWVTSVTNPLGYVEKFSYNSFGLVKKIDRPVGYADTSILLSAPTGQKGFVKHEKIGSSSRHKIVTTTFDGYGRPILIQTSNKAKSVSIFRKFTFDKLGNKAFESWPSYSKTVSNGVTKTHDVLERVTQIQETVSPNARVQFKYLSDNRIQRIDENGNSTIVHFSGFGSPFDGKETRLEYPNKLNTYLTYDKWQNLIQINHSGKGKSLLRKFKYNSRHQLCFVYTPEAGTEAYTYNSGGQMASLEKGVSENYTCEDPASVSISSLEKTCTTRTHMIGTEFGFMGHVVTTCNYENSYRDSSKLPTNPVFPCNMYSSQPSLMPLRCISFSPGVMATSLGSNETNSTNKVMYSHNALGQVTKIDYPANANENDVLNTYSNTGKLISSKRGGTKLSYSYGLRGEILTESLSIDGNTFSIKNEYNDTGGLVAITTPNDIKIKYNLNELDQITSINVGSKKYVDKITYHENDIIKYAEFSTNLSESDAALKYSTTLNNRMVIEKYSLMKKNKKIASYLHSYYKNGNLKKITSLVNLSKWIGTRDYVYDSINQIVSASNNDRTETYTFDVFSNFITKQFSKDNTKITETFEYSSDKNRLNKITVKNDSPKGQGQKGRKVEYSYLNFSHDENGRLVRHGDQVNLDLNFDGLIVRASKTNNFTQTFEFDGLNNRVKHKDSNQEYTATKYSLQSANGKLLYEALADNKGKVQQTIAMLQLRNIAVLRMEVCNYWIIANPSNNLKILFSNKNNLLTAQSVSPFGSSWDADYKNNFDSSARCEKKNTNNNTTPITPVTPVAPVYPLPNFPPGTCYSCGLVAVASETMNTKIHEDKYLFRNVYRDNNTGFYFLPGNRFYDPVGVRYLTPKSNRDYNNIKNKKFLLNLYSIAENNPISIISESPRTDRTFLNNNGYFDYRKWDHLLEYYAVYNRVK